MAVDFYLKVDKMTGEAVGDAHKDEIKIHSWSWGASQTTSVSGTGGSGAGRASLSDLSVMKDYDASSPQLFQALLKGTHIATGVLSAYKSAGDDQGKIFLKISLGELFVTSVQASASSEIPMESVSFSYNTIKVEYSSQDEKGVLTSKTPVSYNTKSNVVS